MRQNKRNEAFRLVLNAAERQALRALAERDGDSQAAVVRRLVRRAANDGGLWPPPGTVKAAASEAVRP